MTSRERVRRAYPSRVTVIPNQKCLGFSESGCEVSAASSRRGSAGRPPIPECHTRMLRPGQVPGERGSQSRGRCLGKIASRLHGLSRDTPRPGLSRADKQEGEGPRHHRSQQRERGMAAFPRQPGWRRGARHPTHSPLRTYPFPPATLLV